MAMTSSPVATALVERLRAAGCVYAEQEADLLLEATSGDRAPERLESLVRRRLGGTPLEHVLGWAEFRGLRIAVSPRVFVPRRRSELLVREALEVLAPGDVALDLCCGTGAIAAALIAERPGIVVHASDIDPAAVSCARRNLGDERVHLGDLYDGLPERLRGQIAVIVANAPYVPSASIATMPREAREHESRVALDGGLDGVDLQGRVVAGAREWLRPDGWLMIETSVSQGDLTLALMRSEGFSPHLVHDQELDGTVAVATSTPSVV